MNRRIWSTFSVLLAFTMLGSRSAASDSQAVEVTVDASKVTGKIKPLQDLHDGPLNSLGFIDVSHFYRSLDVRNTRLSGPVSYGKSVQTLGTVFPNADADPDSPESYDFALTDRYLKSIADLGINVIYGLYGSSSAEHSPDRYPRMDPPKSYERWANMVSHIVRHYNAGWDNGPGFKISYWEVWNEPDIPTFWRGTADDYYRLYEVAARKLKATDPSVKIGGPALAIDLAFLEGFLRYCRDKQVPLDFVSWHYYSPDPHEAAKQARRIRELMDRYGFNQAESLFDEWNYIPPAPSPTAEMEGWTGILDQPENWQAKTHYTDLIHGEFGAAYDATMLIALQDAPVDMAIYYTGSTMMLGLFTPLGGPTKAYSSFLAFRQLLDCPERLSVKTVAEGDVSALAGVNKGRSTLRLLVSTIDHGQHSIRVRLKNLPWPASHYEIQSIDHASGFSRIKAGKLAGSKTSISFDTQGPSVLLVTMAEDSNQKN
jgi:hypothetical protein